MNFFWIFLRFIWTQNWDDCRKFWIWKISLWSFKKNKVFFLFPFLFSKSFASFWLNGPFTLCPTSFPLPSSLASPPPGPFPLPASLFPLPLFHSPSPFPLSFAPCPNHEEKMKNFFCSGITGGGRNRQSNGFFGFHYTKSVKSFEWSSDSRSGHKWNSYLGLISF